MAGEEASLCWNLHKAFASIRRFAKVLARAHFACIAVTTFYTPARTVHKRVKTHSIPALVPNHDCFNAHTTRPSGRWCPAYEVGRSLIQPGGTMKLKDRDWTEVERRFGATGSELMQEDKTVRAAFLALAVSGAAVLVGMAVYLIFLSPPSQDSDPSVSAMRRLIPM